MKNQQSKISFVFPKVPQSSGYFKSINVVTSDAIVMGNNAPTVQGSEQIKGLFENTFKR